MISTLKRRGFTLWLSISIAWLPAMLAALFFLSAGLVHAAPPPGYSLVWDDEFNQGVGNPPSSANWQYYTGPGSAFGNSELETYTNAISNCQIVADPNATDGEVLQIQAQDTNGGVGTAGDYTSARIYSAGLEDPTYGFFEARVKLPYGVGVWPAFWMLGDNSVAWPGCGEMDIMENIGMPQWYGVNESSTHSLTTSGTEETTSNTYLLPPGQDFYSNYHLFQELWCPNSISYYVDGNLFQTVTPSSLDGNPWIFDQPFYFLLNLAVGGTFPGNPNASTQFPQDMLVDYVRVYSGTPQVPATPTSVAAAGGPDGAQTVLSWPGVPGATSYNIYRGATSGGEGTTPYETVLGGYNWDSGLTPGTKYYYKVAAVNPGGTSALSNEVSYTPAAAADTPYFSSPAAIPGTIGFHNYDNGGQGVGYSVADSNQSLLIFRPEERVSVFTTQDVTGLYDIGYLSAGDWLNFTVDVATAGTYNVAFRFATDDTGMSCHLQNASGTNLTGAVVVPDSGGFETWETVNATVTLPAGTQVLRFVEDTGGVSINYMTFTQASAPVAPTGLTATAVSGQVALSWTASSGATSYNIYRGTSASGENSTPVASGITTTAYTNTGLANGTTYYYTVAAVSSGGLSGYSSEAVSTPTAAGPFGGTPSTIPGLIHASNYDVGGPGVSYDVTSINGTGNSYRTDGVDLEVTADADGGWDVGWTTSGQWFNYTVTVPTAGAYTVNFRVAAPDAVTDGFHLSNASGTSLTGSVNIPASGGWQDCETVSATVSLPAGTQVLKLDQDTSGYNINSMTFVATSAPSAPAAPTSLTATAENAQIGLSWTASSGATSYNVYRGTSSGGESATAIATGVTTTSYTNTGLTNGTAYYYKITAVNAEGTSGYSNEASATPAGVPAAPTSLSATAGNAEVALSWKAASGATTYNVYRGTSSGGESSTPIATGITATTYSNTGLANGTKYYFKVAAVDGAGTSGYSSEASATPLATAEGPYGGTPAAIPGTIYAVNYDLGGQGVGYDVTSVNGTANSYRSDGVDIETCTDTTTNGYDLGWTSAGQWFRYTVDVATAGTYNVAFRVSDGAASTGTLYLENSAGTNLSGNVVVSPTGGWQTWTTYTFPVALPAGQQVLTVYQDTGNYNINYLTFTLG